MAGRKNTRKAEHGSRHADEDPCQCPHHRDAPERFAAGVVPRSACEKCQDSPEHVRQYGEPAEDS